MQKYEKKGMKKTIYKTIKKLPLYKGFFLFRTKVMEKIKTIIAQGRSIIVSVLKNILTEQPFKIESKLYIDYAPPFFIRIPALLFGKIYHRYKIREEKTRVWFFNFFDSVSSTRILYEIVHHSRGLIFTMALLALLCFAPYFLVFEASLTVNQNLITTLLIAYVGGGTAILGIIFALYAVGFQTTTERFSSNVTDYLNSERVGKFFFKLLTFSSVFSLINLIIQEGTTVSLVVPFAISTVLFVLSLIGIVIFKDDYMTKLKPKRVFQRLYDQGLEAIKYVNAFDHPSIAPLRLTRNPNVKSFKTYLPIHRSWSLIAGMQTRVEDRIEITSELYDDLIREGRTSDAVYGIMYMGHLLAKYASVKHFIDRKWGWWFPVYQEVVTADSAEMLPIKANYEAMGIGRLGTTKRDYDWLENKVLNFFKRIQDETDFEKYPLIGNALIFAYQTALAGRFNKTEKGLEKELRGSFESQDFELFEKTLKQFVDFGEKISGVESCESNFLNALGDAKTVCIDGFSLRSFPGRLNDWKPPVRDWVKKLFNGTQIAVEKRDIVSWRLPAYSYALAIDCFEKLQVEQTIEGVVVTPASWLENDLLEKHNAKEIEVVKKYRQQLVANILQLSKNPKGKLYKDYSGGIILGMFNQLISQERWNELEEIITVSYTELFQYFISVDSKKFLEQEYREPIDFGVFESLTERRRLVFAFYLKLFFMSQVHLFLNRKSDDSEALLKTARRPLMLGGLCYLISELDQDNYYIIAFTQAAEKLYPTTNLSEIYGAAVDVTKKLGFGTSFRINYEEANRYSGYFGKVSSAISKLPRDYITSGSVPFGLSSRETVKHPSRFIRQLAEFRFSDMDQCLSGYVKWLEKREKIKKLIDVLSAMQK